MKKTTLTFNEDTIDVMLELIDWGLTDYSEPNDERYNEIINLANRLEKAKCRINGQNWEEEKVHSLMEMID